MRFFETLEGDVKSDYQILNAVYICSGVKHSEDDIDGLVGFLHGIKREITDFTEWKRLARCGKKLSAVQLYRGLTGCGVQEARKAIERETGEKMF